MSLCDIIIPSWNNPQYLIPCLNSIITYTQPDDLYQIYVVNNGSPESVAPLLGNKYVTVLQQSENLGWEGGLKAGLAASRSPFVLFMNDDTAILPSQRYWLLNLINRLGNPKYAAVGPTSNVVMGRQQVFYTIHSDMIEPKFLIGFCMLVRRSDLEAAGGVDDTLPGGDDLDLSIRLRKLGKKLLIDRNVFVWHHGFKTGERVKGTDWNSLAMIERTNFALMMKHSLHDFIDLQRPDEVVQNGAPQNWGDPEEEICLKYMTGEKVAELGCGDKKTRPDVVGIDIVPKGQEIPGLNKGRLSLADVNANVENDLPIKDFDTILARHVLEHMVDAVGAVQSWVRSLRPGGRLIIAVPDHTVRNTILMNWEHRHAWTPASLTRFMEALGMKTINVQDAGNQVSFVGVFERN